MKRTQYHSEEERGSAYVELWRKNPKLLPELLGNFYDTSPRGVLLRRLLLATHIPPRWMEVAGNWIVSLVGKEKWSVFLLQYGFWFGVYRSIRNHATWTRLTQGVPILMYHAFGGPGEGASRFVLPVRKFKIQMWILRFLKYHVIRLDDYLKYMENGQLPPERSIILTIDDGYEDNYSLAYPILKQFGFPATIFLVSSYLGQTNRWDRDEILTGRALFGLTAAKEMQNDGISFGSHTRTHPFLTRLSQQQTREEICQSKADLEQNLGIRIRLFSYPYGDYDDQVAAAVKETGFDGACTTDTGLNTFQTSTFALRRTEIFGTFSLWRFLRAVFSGVS